MMSSLDLQNKLPIVKFLFIINDHMYMKYNKRNRIESSLNYNL